MLLSRTVLMLWGFGACAPAEPPLPPEPPGPSLAPCSVADVGTMAERPQGWVRGSTPGHAVWRTASGWRHDGGLIEATAEEGPAWVVRGQLWVAHGSSLQLHDLEGGVGSPLDLVALGDLEPGERGVVDLAVTGSTGEVPSVWVALVGTGDEPASWLLHLQPDASSGTWSLAGRYPESGSAPVRYQAVAGVEARAAVAFEAPGGRGVQVVSRRGKPLRKVGLPAAVEGAERVALGMVGQGVLTVLADGRVLLDRPGHRHTEALDSIAQIAVGSEGLIAVGRDGRARARVRRGVELVEGLVSEGLALGVATRGEGALVVTSTDDGPGSDAWVIVRGPMQPDTVGPTWAPRVTAPHRCALKADGELLLPPLLGADGSVRLVVQPPPGAEGGAPPPRWLTLAPPEPVPEP